jgi:hypothetical protein
LTAKSNTQVGDDACDPDEIGVGKLDQSSNRRSTSATEIGIDVRKQRIAVRLRGGTTCAPTWPAAPALVSITCGC